MIRFIEGTDIIDLGWGDAHSDRSPSGADRWMLCAGSVQASKLFDDEPNEYSAEGTCAHWVREQCLRNGQNVDDFVGKTIHADGFYFDVLPVWVGFLQPTIDWAREIGGIMSVELKLPLSPWLPNDKGTLDLGIVTDDLIYVNDLKFGQGVMVGAERNRQQMIYALAYWQHFARHHTKATRFRLMIDQPRSWSAEPGECDWWDVELDELLAFGEEVKLAGIRTEDPDAPFCASVEACIAPGSFCPVADNNSCPAVHDLCQDLIGLNPDVPEIKGAMTMPDIEKLSPERRSYIITNWPLVVKWQKTLFAEMTNDALMGDPAPGYKAVATEKDRMWTDEESVEAFCREKDRVKVDDLFTRKLKSPAQMEKLVGTRIWAKLQPYIHRPDGAPALVPESDKRPALINAVDLLDDLPDDDGFDDLI